MNTLTTHWNSLHSKLRGFVLKRVKDTVVTDDIVQDVFLKVQSKIGQLSDDQKISGWIFSIAKNTIIDHFRKESIAIQAVDLDWESDMKALNECASQCVVEALAMLPDKYREALELTELQNISQLQLAERLQISYSGAKSRVQRARQMLKEKLDELYRIEMDKYGNVVVCEHKGPCKCSESLLESC